MLGVRDILATCKNFHFAAVVNRFGQSGVRFEIEMFLARSEYHAIILADAPDLIIYFYAPKKIQNRPVIETYFAFKY